MRTWQVSLVLLLIIKKRQCGIGEWRRNIEKTTLILLLLDFVETLLRSELLDVSQPRVQGELLVRPTMKRLSLIHI